MIHETGFQVQRGKPWWWAWAMVCGVMLCVPMPARSSEVAGPAPRQTTTITVTQPSGGATWTPGSLQTIQWVADVRVHGTAYYVELVRVSSGAVVHSWLQYSGGAGVQPETRSLTVTVPAAASGTYRIRVRSAYTNGSGTSGEFTIAADTGIRVESPVGGEVRTAGSSMTVQWVVNAAVHGSAYFVELAAASGGAAVATWIQWSPIAAQQPERRSLTITLPAATAGQYVIRVRAAWSGATASSGSFQIDPGLSVLAPAAGAAWPVGSQQTVRWTVDTRAHGTAYRIELVRASTGAVAATWVQWSAAASVQPETRQLTVTVPGVAADQYYVRVTAIWSGMSASSAMIRVEQSMQVLAPTAGATWGIGTQQTVRWTVDTRAHGTAYQIELVRASTGAVAASWVQWSAAASVQPETRQLTVTVPGVAADQYNVRVTAIWSGVSASSGAVTVKVVREVDQLVGTYAGNVTVIRNSGRARLTAGTFELEIEQFLDAGSNRYRAVGSGLFEYDFEYDGDEYWLDLELLIGPNRDINPLLTYNSSTRSLSVPEFSVSTEFVEDGVRVRVRHDVQSGTISASSFVINFRLRVYLDDTLYVDSQARMSGWFVDSLQAAKSAGATAAEGAGSGDPTLGQTEGERRSAVGSGDWLRYE